MSEKELGQASELEVSSSRAETGGFRGLRRRFVVWLPLFAALVAAASGLGLVWWLGLAEPGRRPMATLWGVVAVVGAALLAGIVVARLLGGPIVRGLDELVAGSERLAGGDLDQRFELETGDELELLAVSMNEVAAGWRGATRRATELEDFNDGLLKLNEELQELDRTKSRMLANVSYELHEPLTAIGGYVEAIREGQLGQLSAAQRESLEVLETNLQRLMGTVGQLLTFSRVESQRLEVHLRPFQLEPVVRRVVDSLRRIHGDTLNLQFVCSPDLPEVVGDPERISQVLDNLLTNAIKFSPEGGYIEVAVTQVDDGVAVQVTDQGVGIPEEEQERVFRRFYQLDAGSEKARSGIGLGLAIVREILEHHNTEVYLDSRPGMGSTFGFVLPVLTDKSARSTAALATLVMIDGDTGFVEETVGYLNHRGFSVQTASSVQQGLRLVRRVQPDVVLLDRMLDDGDGFNFISKQQDDESIREIPVIVVSALQERSLGLGLGASEYLVKPVSPSELEEAVLRFLGEKRGS